MVMHMIACCESMTHVLSYGLFLTRVFKDVGNDLSREMDFEVLSIYNTYDDWSMERIKLRRPQIVLGKSRKSTSIGLGTRTGTSWS